MGAKRTNPRQPKGTSVGGQFAARPRLEDAIALRERAFDAIEDHRNNERRLLRLSAKAVAVALLEHAPDAETLSIGQDEHGEWEDFGLVHDADGEVIGSTADYPGGIDLLALRDAPKTQPKDLRGFELVEAPGFAWLDITDPTYRHADGSMSIDLRVAAAQEL